MNAAAPRLPVAKGFLLLENRTASGYDASIPFCADEAGALFVDEAAQYLAPLDLTVEHTPPTAADFTPRALELCDVYALQGHNDTFTFGGWKISNVSAPGPIMTLDIEKLAIVSTIDHYRLAAFYDENGARVRHEVRFEDAESTIDYSQLHGGSSRTGFVSIGRADQLQERHPRPHRHVHEPAAELKRGGSNGSARSWGCRNAARIAEGCRGGARCSCKARKK